MTNAEHTRRLRWLEIVRQHSQVTRAARLLAARAAYDGAKVQK